ncbi:MAG: hypothetical protein KKG13_01075 [Nanoarchaeota archaeon]|nr:hypothetical protein [Nanoarchaeota archaeon]
MKLENYLLSIDPKIKIFGASKELKKLHNKNKSIMINILKDKSHISSYYNWISGKTPISLEKILKLRYIDDKIVENIFRECNTFSVGEKKCKLPKDMTNELSYLIGALHGDGSLHKNKKYIAVTGESERYLEDVLNPLFKNIFEVKCGLSKFKGKKYYYRITVGSKVIQSFLSIFCPIGKKKGKLKIPKIIRNKKSFLLSYLSGLFDTDGCLTHAEKGRKQLYFTFLQSDKKFVLDVYKSLINLKLRINHPYRFMSPKKPGELSRDLIEWRLYIGSKKDLSNFLKKINFLHPDKKMRAELILNKIQRQGQDIQLR